MYMNEVPTLLRLRSLSTRVYFKFVVVISRYIRTIETFSRSTEAFLEQFDILVILVSFFKNSTMTNVDTLRASEVDFSSSYNYFSILIFWKNFSHATSTGTLEATSVPLT